MKCRVKLFSTSPTCLAADGSHIPPEVFTAYVESEAYRKAMENRTCVGGLTHRSRNLSNANSSGNPSTLSKSIGKSDMQLLVGEKAAPIFYITKLELMPDEWVYADIQLFDEAMADDEAAQCIKRLKYLLLSGVKPGVSAVVLGYWDSSTTGGDILRKLVSINGLDITLNPSWKDAQVVKVYDDEGNLIGSEEKNFSDIEFTPSDFEFTGLKVKAFSDLNSLGIGDLPKSSKINGQFTKLGAKVYSATGGMVEGLPESEPEVEQKEFSVATVKERVRFATKLSPRVRFRRLILDYKLFVKAAGGVDKLDAETLKVAKSLLTIDALEILRAVTPEIVQSGKQINTVLGLSSISKNLRVAGQKLQIPLIIIEAKEFLRKYF